MEKQKQEKHLRKRKKKILNSIREQIEFYFSDANLRHDRFMRQLVAVDDEELKGTKFVDLNEFLKFNKISEITKKLRDISLALESSKCLSLDTNQMTVKRNEPFLQNESNFDESTVYVERLPPNADQQWIRSVFGPFGRIQYIKIPRFRHNNNIMGFAFIEYSEPEAAEKALKHFSALSSNGNKNQTQTDAEEKSDPEVEQMSSSSQNDTKIQSEVVRKRGHESDGEEEVVSSKKSKVCEQNDSNIKLETIAVKTEENSETNPKTKKKKKRKRKRKQIQTDSVEETEPEVNNLRVMSKKEWKRWKNKYLKLQKQTMSSIKRTLLVETPKETEEKPQNLDNKEVADSVDRNYESGLIIKLVFSMPSKDLNEFEFKRKIRQMGAKHEIQYIDLPLNRLEFTSNQTVCGVCYIRTNSGEDSKRLMANEKLKQMGDPVVLDGTEECDYWNQIFEQRIKKKSNNCENKDKHKLKVRGFDRIINRAENVSTGVETKLNKHIKFDT